LFTMPMMKWISNNKCWRKQHVKLLFMTKTHYTIYITFEPIMK
jgi:hypothetical protein